MDIDYGRGAWQTYTADHSVDDAVASFVRRYGVQPAHVGIDRRWKVPTLKVGPVPDQEV
jgi:hypothetical protein